MLQSLAGRRSGPNVRADSTVEAVAHKPRAAGASRKDDGAVANPLKGNNIEFFSFETVWLPLSVYSM